jgi:nucleoside-diphosphate-sugar epimerase
LKPQSPYAASKLHAEQRLQSLGEGQVLYYVTCLFGSIFGISPGMRIHTAINKFCWQAVIGQPITVCGLHCIGIYPISTWSMLLTR